MAASPTDQCIVLPLRAGSPRPFDGTGLALHFLLGNVLVLHTDLKEMWFGWRVKKIFAHQQALARYCRDAAERLDLAELSREQKIRFWITGTYTDRSAILNIFDAESPSGSSPIDLPISVDDRLVGFRSRFIDHLAAMGRPIAADQAQAALWPESISHAGLDAVGRALEQFYIYSAYGGEGSLGVTPFKQAVVAAPESFMAQDLYGWALYRNRDYIGAKIAFLTSLRINPAGAGAMSGLMWCGIYGRDIEEALFWSGRKADVCRQDVKAARETGRKRYHKVNG